MGVGWPANMYINACFTYHRTLTVHGGGGRRTYFERIKF